MNTDALLPTTEPILYENHHTLGARSSFLISRHLCIWQCITGNSLVHPLGSVSFLFKKKKKKNPFFDHILQWKIIDFRQTTVE